jgi:hypothetical protein
MKKVLKATTFAIIFLLSQGYMFGKPLFIVKKSNSIEILKGKKENPVQKENLLELYKNLDGKILTSGDENAVKSYLVEKNKQIFSYLKTKYPKFESLDGIDVNDENFIVFGLVYALAEHGGYLQSVEARPVGIPGWLQCVGGVLGVTEIYGLISGASTMTYGTAWGIVKKLVKRYVGWLGVGLALWEIATECF